MAKKKSEGYLSARESRRISKENRRITNAFEKQRKRKNVPESEYLTQMRDPNNAVEFDNLHTYFFTDAGTVKSVDGVTFDIPIGKTVGVVGESGCGKSTLGRTILGLLPATSGQILFDGEDVTHAKGKQRKALQRKMQIIFQDPYSSLNPRYCIFELISEPLRTYHLCANKQALQKRVFELMDEVSLARRYAYAYPHELDGGRRQRVGIACALALEPELIVCDEPVSALDVSIQAQVLNLLQDLQEEKGLTYIFVTHDLSVVKHISDDIMVMYVGCTVEKCAAEELFQAPLHPYTKGLLSAIPVPNIHRERKRIVMQGELTTPIDPAPGCRFANRCPYAKERCQNEMPCYEEVLPAHFVACHYVREVNGLAGAAHA